jgi:hypothetical protein
MNAQENLYIRLDKTFATEDIVQIKSKFSHTPGVTVRSEKRTLGLLPELLAVTPVAGLVVSTANLLLAVTRDVRQVSGERQLDFDKFTKSMKTELAKLGLLDWKLKSVDDFVALTEGQGRPCKIVIETASGEYVGIHAVRNGNVLNLRQE